MARTNTLGNFLTDVANAIREKKGTTEAIQASNFDTEIANLPSSGGLDWSALGFSDTPDSIKTNYAYSKSIQDNWVPSANLANKFQNNQDMVYMPTVDTSIAQFTNAMFRYCSKLKSVAPLNIENSITVNQMFMGDSLLEDLPYFNLPKATTASGFIQSCNSLTDESLDNVLRTCVSMTSITEAKTFKLLTNNTYYTAERLQALPHYQDFIDAGWTIGY